MLSSQDTKVARSLFDKMWQALGTKDTAGAITADMKAKPVVATQIAEAIENIKGRYAVSDVTGEKFTIDPSGNPQRVVTRGPAQAPAGGSGAGKGSGGRIVGKIGGVTSILDFGSMMYFMIRYGPENFLCIMTGMNCPRPVILA